MSIPLGSCDYDPDSVTGYSSIVGYDVLTKEKNIKVPCNPFQKQIDADKVKYKNYLENDADVKGYVPADSACFLPGLSLKPIGQTGDIPPSIPGIPGITGTTGNTIETVLLPTRQPDFETLIQENKITNGDIPQIPNNNRIFGNTGNIPQIPKNIPQNRFLNRRIPQIPNNNRIFGNTGNIPKIPQNIPKNPKIPPQNVPRFVNTNVKIPTPVPPPKIKSV
jgi:hypothetical protein